MWESEACEYSLGDICAAHGVSRQAYYQYQKHQANKRFKQEIVLQLVCQVRARQPRIGVRKLYHMLKPEFEHVIQLGKRCPVRLTQRPWIVG